MKTVTVLLRIMLVLVLVCSVLPKAYASDTVPWLTGNFTLTCFAGSCSGGDGSGVSSFQPPPYGQMVFSPPPNLPYTYSCERCDDPAYGTWEWDYAGSAIGGAVGFSGVQLQYSDPALGFNGWMTGGSVTGWVEDFGTMLNTDPINQWYLDFTFRGVWDNGWWSVGTANMSTDSTGDAWGTVEMTTYTPEPGTFALLGSAILGVAGVLRRRLPS